MPAPVTDRPAICLNMIVRNEAHIVRELLDSVAPYISSWVIVDTGSDDGTQDVIRDHMAGLGIPGELHERPWRNFGANRTEALGLARGHADYTWVMDADDLIVGTPDFTGLDADVYTMRIGQAQMSYWRRQLFRDGAKVRYEGVIHEHAVCDGPHTAGRIEGDYHIESRRLGARNREDARKKYIRDVLLLLDEVDRDPEDTRSVFYLAQSYFDLRDFVNARRWYARRAEMGGWQEEIYYSMLRVAESMDKLGEPWSEVQNAYLRAWEFRPARAEALNAVAAHYRAEQDYQLGYLFAARAAEIPDPDTDILFVRADVYTWRALDEQAVCAERIGRKSEAFALCRRLVAVPDIPEADRQRIAGNRDFSVTEMLEAASSYPESAVTNLAAHKQSAPDTDVTVSVVAGSDRGQVEQTLNSFLHCCRDIRRAGRFLVVDTGLSIRDRGLLRAQYPFLEFTDAGPGAGIADITTRIGTRFWLHLGQGWRFFAAENYITRLTAVLDAEQDVFQVGVNFADAAKLTGTCAAEEAVRRTLGAGRYVLTDTATAGPAMFDTARLAQSGGIDAAAAAAGLCTATLDEVLCIEAS